MVNSFFPPPRNPHHPALLRKSYLPGRIRGTAEAILDTVLAHPNNGASVLSKELRNARQLHSRERKFVADGLFALIRYHAFLEHVLNTRQAAQWWDAWLQWQGCTEMEQNSPDLAKAAHQIRQHHSQRDAFRMMSGFCEPISNALVDSLGTDCWDFLYASNQKGPVVLRVNPIKASREKVQATLFEQEIQTQPIADLPLALRVEGTANLQGQKTYQKGWFEIQDAGSQRLAQLAGEPRGTVIDYCAGAGGKTLAMAALGTHSTQFIACDVRERALHELRKRCQRAGIGRRVSTYTLPSAPLTPADTVFVDAPCSGLGTLRRTPTLRLRLDQAELTRLEHLQKKILMEAQHLVKPKGTLIYGTCSVLHQENEAITEWFLSEAPQFQIAPGTQPLKQTPHQHDTDGFYGVVFTRRD